MIAPSFADIFYSNALENGLLAVPLPADAMDEVMRRYLSTDAYHLTVDLLTQRVTDARGLDVAFVVAPYHRELLLQGLDPISRTLREESRIAAYEARR